MDDHRALQGYGDQVPGTVHAPDLGILGEANLMPYMRFQVPDIAMARLCRHCHERREQSHELDLRPVRAEGCRKNAP